MTEGGFSPEIQKRVDELPAAAHEFITGPEMGKAVHAIGAKHQLHIDQIGALDAEVFATIIGISELEELAENIEGALSLDAQKSAALAKDINEEIFLKIRETMKGSGQKPAQEIASKAPLAVQTPPPVPVQTHEVVMPSSVKPAAPPMPAPAAAPVAIPTPPSTPVPVPKPPMAPNLRAADAALSEKKVTPPAAAPTPAPAPITPATPAASPMPKVDPAQPQNYKADPYREPVE